MNSLYAGLYKTLVRAVRWFYKIEIIGAENEPKDGAYIACSNHLSNSDVIILAASLNRQVRFFAKAELFKIPGLSQLITALGAFPIQRGKGDVSSIKNTIKLLDDGEVIGFYPQGHRYPGVHPSSTKFQYGVGLIVSRSHAPVLPISLYSKGWKIRPFKRTVIVIGKPMSYESLGSPCSERSGYEASAKEIFAQIIKNMPADI